ncbi:hypothetical protein D3C72_2601350 [compost metagenome]
MILALDMSEQTLVMTTHEVEEVEPLLDWAMLINDGQLRGYEKVEHIHSEYGFGVVGWMKNQLSQA